MECFSCREDIPIKEKIKKYMIVKCESCGCTMQCLDVNEYISRWKVMSTKTLNIG